MGQLSLCSQCPLAPRPRSAGNAPHNGGMLCLGPGLFRMMSYGAVGREEDRPGRPMATARGVLAVVSVGLLALSTLHGLSNTLLASTGPMNVRVDGLGIRSPPAQIAQPNLSPGAQQWTGRAVAVAASGTGTQYERPALASWSVEPPYPQGQGNPFAWLAGLSATILAFAGVVAAFRLGKTEAQPRYTMMSMTANEVPLLPPAVLLTPLCVLLRVARLHTCPPASHIHSPALSHALSSFVGTSPPMRLSNQPPGALPWWLPPKYTLGPLLQGSYVGTGAGL